MLPLLLPLIFAGGISTPQDPVEFAQGPEEFVSTEAGFKISKPNDSWTLTTVPGKLGISALKMGPAEQAGMVQFSLEISVAETQSLDDLRLQVEALVAQMEAMPEVRNGEILPIKIAGLPAFQLQIEQDALGSTFTIHQTYLLAQGLQYKFQAHAPTETYSDYESDFAKAWQSFALIPLNEGALQLAKLRQLAARCGSEVDVLESWSEASKRAQAEGKLIVVAVQAVPGFDVGDQIGSGPFMNQDIIRLLQHRFVVLRWHKGMGAPFEDYDRFGMGPNTFGTGLLVVTPSGDVVRQVFILNSSAVYDVLIDVLQGHPQLSVPEPGQPKRSALDQRPSERLDRIEFFLRSGQLFQAEAMFAGVPADDEASTPEVGHQTREAWLHAELHRLRRQGPEALAQIQTALDLAHQHPGQAEPDLVRLYLDKANLLSVTGSAEAAETLVTRLLSNPSDLDSEIRAEAWMLLGSLRYQANDRAQAEKYWLQIIEQVPESRWAWLVAAAMTGPGWGVEIYPDLRWPPNAQSHLAFIPAAAPKQATKASLQQMTTSAVDYMLASQQNDGSWISASSYGDRKDLGDDFELAATAIGGRALLRQRGRPDAQKSAQRALSWLLNQRKILQQQATPPVVFMDYVVWSRAYCIFFLADCLDAGLGDEKAVRLEIENCLQDLADRQQPNGGWSYYLSGSAGGAAVPQSISFTTATVVMALERAATFGLAIREQGQAETGFTPSALDRGLLCLETMRSTIDTFAYFLQGRDVNQGTRTITDRPGSAARGPACALALLRGGREQAADLTPRFEIYIEHLPGFGVQRRKALMHAGPNAQGSHYLLYDYSTAAEALREVGDTGVPKKLRRQVYEAILRELRASRNADGSFIDNPLIGVDVATGLALNALLDLQACK
jgi:tetratricopeptide (TPR) repeat protein